MIVLNNDYRLTGDYPITPRSLNRRTVCRIVPDRMISLTGKQIVRRRNLQRTNNSLQRELSSDAWMSSRSASPGLVVSRPNQSKSLGQTQ